MRTVRNRLGVPLAVLVLSCAACFGGGPRPPSILPPPPPIDVDLTQQLQRIDGFGASSAWTASNMSDAFADTLFSPDTGIGLSLLRIRIAPDGTTGEMATAQKAFARGVKVWASPWSPPAEWKDGGITGGGHLVPADQQPWADRLASFAKKMSDSGVPLLAISAQNEPDQGPTTYESCVYGPDQLVTFVRDFLGPALASQGVATPIMAPETGNWNAFDSYAGAFASDPAVMSFVGPIATHAYGGTAHTNAAVEATGHAVWQTEYSDASKTLDTGMGSALTEAKTIYDSLVNGQANAWHHWWINSTPAGNNSSLTDSSGQLVRRAYVIGNWSKFVRPGFVRVAATPIPQSSMFASAFSDPASGRVVIVVINLLGSAVDQGFTIAGGTVGSLTPWTTSATAALVAGDPVAVTDGAFTYTLPARSVTSLVSGP